ncbi:hypothetical protein [Actinomadura kijaniata]|uniref:hypothetical protein n=1 Tax=Actinomadura kijaniata TaxID=46161 RepID=UPI000833D41C|nr:hypothetical protein [Actinomadura kijaniata]
MTVDVHVVRVFCDEDGRFGNRLGGVFDSAGLPGEAGTALAARHGRPLTVRQGRGSVISARPAPGAGRADVGGRVVLDGVRSVAL